MKTEYSKIKQNLSVIENKLTEIVKETVTSYLSENFEKTVRKCISDLVTEHLQKESLNPKKGDTNAKKSEAPSSPVLGKEKKVETPCPSAYLRLNLSSQDKKKSEAKATPAPKQEELESMREKYTEIQKLALKKLKQPLYNKNERGFQLLMDDTFREMRREFKGEYLEKAMTLIEKKLRKELPKVQTQNR